MSFNPENTYYGSAIRVNKKSIKRDSIMIMLIIFTRFWIGFWAILTLLIVADNCL